MQISSSGVAKGRARARSTLSGIGHVHRNQIDIL